MTSNLHTVGNALKIISPKPAKMASPTPILYNKSYSGSIDNKPVYNNYSHIPSPPFSAESLSDLDVKSLSLSTEFGPSNLQHPSTYSMANHCVSPVESPVPFNTVNITANFLLFDLDGTLVNTTPAVEYFWRTWAVSYGLDGDDILKTSHGRRSLDVIKEQLPNRPDMHTQEYVNYMEKDIPDNLGYMATPIPGAQTLFNQINEKCGSYADNQWAICTSGSRGLASGWLKCFDWEEPIVFVTSDRCAKGKPNPFGYFTAAKTLEYHQENGTLLSNCRNAKHQHCNSGIDTPPSSPIINNENTNGVKPDYKKFLVPFDEINDSDMSLSVSANNKFSSIVFEDAPAGIQAGKNSGAIVIGLATTYSAERVFEAGADYVVTDLQSIGIKEYNSATKQIVLDIIDPIYTPKDRC